MTTLVRPQHTHTTATSTHKAHSRPLKPAEWSYGGGDSDATGVFCCAPRHAEGAVYRETLDMGRSPRTGAEVQRILDYLRLKYRANAYSLLENNCITFADELCSLLTGQHLPPWLGRLASIGSALSMFLPDSLTGGAEQMAKQRERRRLTEHMRPPVPPLPFAGQGHTLGPSGTSSDAVAASNASSSAAATTTHATTAETPEAAAARREKMREAALRRAQQQKQQQQQQQHGGSSSAGSESGSSSAEGARL